MRLEYMYYLIKKNYNILKEDRATANHENIAGSTKIVSYTITDWDKELNALNEISQIEPYKEIVQSIYDTTAYTKQHSTSASLTPDMYNTYTSLFHELLTKLSGVLHFFDGLNWDECQNGFDIKMPPTDNFDDFAEDINTFQKLVLACPYLRNPDEKILLQKVDVGSIWMCFGIVGVSTMILSNLSKLIDKGVKIKSHMLTCRQQEAQLRAMNQKNEVMEEVIKGFKEYKEELLNQCVDELSDEIGQLKDGEQREQVKKSISALGELMAKGMEIYPSIDAPSEIKDLFPTSDEIKSLPEPIKMLAEETETE